MQTVIFSESDFITEAAELLRQKFATWAQSRGERIETAIRIVRAGKVSQIAENQFIVQSDRGGLERGVSYLVDRAAKTCSCPDYRVHRNACKHRIAVFLAVNAHLLYRRWHLWALAMEAAEDDGAAAEIARLGAIQP
jgi:hypothetical protein